MNRVAIHEADHVLAAILDTINAEPEQVPETLTMYLVGSEAMVTGGPEARAILHGAASDLVPVLLGIKRWKADRAAIATLAETTPISEEDIERFVSTLAKLV